MTVAQPIDVINVNEAIALVMGLDLEKYRALDSNDKSILSMLQRILDGAEIEYADSAKTEDHDQQEAKRRMDEAAANYEFARRHYRDLCKEVADAIEDNHSVIVISSESPRPLDYETALFTMESFFTWAERQQLAMAVPLGSAGTNFQPSISVVEGSEIGQAGHSKSKANKPPSSWQVVTLELRAAHKLRVIAPNYRKDYSINSTALVAKRNNKLTKLGLLLLGLERRGLIPNTSPGNDAPQRLRTSISKLRAALREITGIDADPFSDFSPTEGWKAHFAFRDKRDAKEERELKRTRHVPFDENRDSPTSPEEEYDFDDEGGTDSLLDGEGLEDLEDQNGDTDQDGYQR